MLFLPDPSYTHSNHGTRQEVQVPLRGEWLRPHHPLLTMRCSRRLQWHQHPSSLCHLFLPLSLYVSSLMILARLSFTSASSLSTVSSLLSRLLTVLRAASSGIWISVSEIS